MKALSVRQPWAWGLIHGPKRIENRTWRTEYRGLLLIHAGVSRAELGRCLELPGCPDPRDLAFGALIGIVRLIDCVPLDEVLGQPFAEGPWCWITAEPQAIEPYPYRGALSLFQVPWPTALRV
jgi:hypothetical protein